MTPPLTLDAIVTGAAIGSLMSTMARWARSGGKLRAHKCDADNPTIWRRMWGCNGDGTVPSTKLVRRGHGFTRVPSWRCGSCAAMEAADRVYSSDDYQRLLGELQDVAGVRDYRTARDSDVRAWRWDSVR